MMAVVWEQSREWPGAEWRELGWGVGGCCCCCCPGQAWQEGRGPEGRPGTQALLGLVDSPGKGTKGPGARAGAAREVGRAGDNVGPMVGAGPGVCPERQPVGLNLQ